MSADTQMRLRIVRNDGPMNELFGGYRCLECVSMGLGRRDGRDNLGKHRKPPKNTKFTTKIGFLRVRILIFFSKYNYLF